MRIFSERSPVPTWALRSAATAACCSGVVFGSHDADELIPASVALSGNVRDKLAAAEKAAATNPIYRDYVRALAAEPRRSTLDEAGLPNTPPPFELDAAGGLAFREHRQRLLDERDLDLRLLVAAAFLGCGLLAAQESAEDQEDAAVKAAAAQREGRRGRERRGVHGQVLGAVFRWGWEAAALCKLWMLGLVVFLLTAPACLPAAPCHTHSEH